MSDPWRYRCPEGHTSLTSRKRGYYCQTCVAYYDAAPVDAKADDGDETHPEPQRTPELLTVVGWLWRETGDMDTTARARDISDRPVSASVALQQAADRGLVECIEVSGANRWRVTEDARWLVEADARSEVPA